MRISSRWSPPRTESLVASSVACACCWGLVLREQGRLGGAGWTATARFGGRASVCILHTRAARHNTSRQNGTGMPAPARSHVRVSDSSLSPAAKPWEAQAAAGRSVDPCERRRRRWSGQEAGVSAFLDHVRQPQPLRSCSRAKQLGWEVLARLWSPQVPGPLQHLQGLGQVADGAQRHGGGLQVASGVPRAKTTRADWAPASTAGFMSATAAACAAACMRSLRGQSDIYSLRKPRSTKITVGGAHKRSARADSAPPQSLASAASGRLDQEERPSA